MFRLTDLYPSPAPLTLGGADYLAGQLTVADLAELLHHAERARPHPLVGTRAALAALPEAEQWKLLGRVLRAAKDWNPHLGEPATERYFFTPEGLVVFLYVALRRYNPEFTPESALRLAGVIAVEELLELRRAAFHLTPAKELAALTAEPDDAAAPALDWPAMVDHVARAHGWSYATVGDLTLSQFAIAQCEGVAPPPRQRRVLPGEDLAAIVRERRRKFFGDEGDASGSEQPTNL